jgi:hypothetical protein
MLRPCPACQPIYPSSSQEPGPAIDQLAKPVRCKGTVTVQKRAVLLRNQCANKEMKSEHRAVFPAHSYAHRAHPPPPQNKSPLCAPSSTVAKHACMDELRCFGLLAAASQALRVRSGEVLLPRLVASFMLGDIIVTFFLHCPQHLLAWNDMEHYIRATGQRLREQRKIALYSWAGTCRHRAPCVCAIFSPLNRFGLCFVSWVGCAPASL